MKVLHVYKDCYPPIHGGIEMAIHLLVEGTRDQCDEIRLLVANRKFRTEIVESEGIEVVKVADLGRAFSAPLAPTFPLWLKKMETDIIHLHVPNPTAEVSYLLTKPKGKLIVHYHSDIVRQAAALLLYKPFLQKFLHQADRIIVSSPNYLRSSPFLRPLEEKCVVIPYGIDVRRFDPTPEVRSKAEQLRARYGERLVLFVGQLRYYKGIEYLIEAMRHVDGKCLIVGQGPLMPSLIWKRKHLPYRDKIVLLGPVDNVVPYYYAADVFCLPSSHRSEAFGIVQLEASACGLPLVSTNLDSGVPFVNQHEKTGLIVPPRDAQALGLALQKLLDDAQLRKQYGDYGRDRIHREFTAQVMSEKVLQLYREVMQSTKVTKEH